MAVLHCSKNRLIKTVNLCPKYFLKRLQHCENIKVGDFVKESRRFTQAEVYRFAELSGDFNPVHIDPAFVEKAGVYRGTIVHGAFLNAFVSCILGTKLPGPGSIAVSQEMRFRKPLYVDETVEGKVSVIEIKKQFVTCSVQCHVDGQTVYEGKATVWLKKSE